MLNRTLIIVLGALATVALCVLFAIFKFYDGDKAIAIGALITVIGLFIPQLMQLRQSAANADAIQDVHTIVNSQKTAMIAEIAALRAELLTRPDLIEVKHDEA